MQKRPTSRLSSTTRTRSLRGVSGASTLSMQTARLLERSPPGDWGAKLRQARVALALERRLGKALTWAQAEPIIRNESRRP